MSLFARVYLSGLVFVLASAPDLFAQDAIPQPDQRRVNQVVPVAPIVVPRAQPRRPGLSGTWAPVGPVQGGWVITQSTSTLTMAPAPGEPGVTTVYQVDGSEVRDGDKMIKAEWTGNQLRIATLDYGSRTSRLILMSLNDRGELVMEVQDGDAPPRTTIYVRK
jgi:hypothetical protein